MFQPIEDELSSFNDIMKEFLMPAEEEKDEEEKRYMKVFNQLFNWVDFEILNG